MEGSLTVPGQFPSWCWSGAQWKEASIYLLSRYSATSLKFNFQLTVWISEHNLCVIYLYYCKPSIPATHWPHFNISEIGCVWQSVAHHALSGNVLSFFMLRGMSYNTWCFRLSEVWLYSKVVIFKYMFTTTLRRCRNASGAALDFLPRNPTFI